MHLQNQPMLILVALLDRPGQLVTREQLSRELWPADTFVDFDMGLNTAIRKLRQALGDSTERPKYIETHARRGYRFIAPVTVADADPVSPFPPVHPAADKEPPKAIPAAPIAVFQPTTPATAATEANESAISEAIDTSVRSTGSPGRIRRLRRSAAHATGALLILALLLVALLLVALFAVWHA